YVSNMHGFAQYSITAAVTLLVSAAVSGSLLMSRSPRAQGLALSIIGSFVVAIVGASVYGFWIIGW
ncbi:MAG: hypothetical protein ACRDUX_39350, partial [Mycobacterium sp.]